MLGLLAGYIWLFIHRPFEIWRAFQVVPVERIYMGAMLLYWLTYPEKGWVRNRLTSAFAGLLLVLLLCWVASPYPDLGVQVVEDYAKVGVFYVLMMSTVRDEAQLRKLLAAFLMIVGLYMSHSLWEFHNGKHEYRMGIVRMVGVDTSYGNPNGFAATLVCALPMTFPFWAESRGRRRAQVLLLGYTVLTVVCVVLTGSRSGFVGLGFIGLIRILLAGRRVRLMLSMALVLPIVWASVPASLQNRFLTLIDPSYGPKNAQISAEARTEFFRIGLRLWQQSPVTGFGPESFRVASGTGYNPHQLYAQILSELGSLGVVAFVGVILVFAGNGAEMRRLRRRDTTGLDGFPYEVSRAVSTSILLLLLMGLSSHNLYRYYWMWFGGFQAIAVHCARGRVAAAEHAPSVRA